MKTKSAIGGIIERMEASAAGFVALTASNIQDVAGNLLAAGTLEVLPTDTNNLPITAAAGGAGGQMSSRAPAIFSITNGVLQAGAQIADTTQTRPANICYRFTIKDASGTPINVIKLVQTTANTAFNLDAYQPNVSAQAVVQTGPAGPAGPAGPTGPTGATGPAGAPGSGGGTTATKTIEAYFASAGSATLAHNLNCTYPLTSCFVKSGSSSYSLTPVDANHMLLTVDGASDLICAFGATATLSASYAFTLTPLSMTYSPTMLGPQTVTYAISQTGLNGYTGTVTYSLSGLAAGMTASFSVGTITGTGTSTLTVSFAAGQTPATTQFLVSTTDGTSTNSATASLTITDINSGLVAGWPMQDGPASFADATSGADTLTGTAITAGTVAGFGSNAAIFNGSSSKAVGANQANTNFTGATPFSVCLWATFTLAGTNCDLASDIDPTASSVGWDFFRTSGNGLGVLLVNNYPNNWINVNSSGVTLGVQSTPQFLCFTYDGSKTAAGVSMYLNGVAVPTSISTNTLTGSIASTKPITIGSRSDGTYPHKGSIGFVRVYNKQLTATEIAAYYGAGPR